MWRGFGTYPFGEEWLFDAVIRSYLPVLEVARDLTMTVTPVLADQLEDGGVRERLRRFLVEWRIGAAEADLPEVPAECRPAVEGGAGALPARARSARPRWRRPIAGLPGGGGQGTGGAGDLGRDPRGAAAAGDAAGAAAAARHRDSLAPAPLRLGRRLLAAGVRLRSRPRVATGGSGGALVLRRPERARAAAAGAGAGADAGRPGGAADRLGGDRLALVARRLPLRPRPRPVRRQIAARDPALEGGGWGV